MIWRLFTVLKILNNLPEFFIYLILLNYFSINTIQFQYRKNILKSFKQAYLSISVILCISNVTHKDKYLLRQSQSLLIMLYLENATNERPVHMI